MHEEKSAVRRLKRGDVQGLEYLATRYYDRALHTSFLVTLDRDRAEDVVQTVFLELRRKIGRYDENRPLEPWLMRVVVNATLDELRRDSKMAYMDEISAADDLVQFERLLDGQALPEAAVESAELQEAIWKALNGLSPRQRATVVLFYYLDMNETEISRQLQAPKSSVKWWLRAGRENLRKLLRSFAGSGQEGK